jgi:hypothetical protein
MQPDPPPKTQPADPDEIGRLSTKIAAEDRTAKRLSMARLGAFFLLLAGAAVGLDSPIVSLWICPPALIAFLLALVAHLRALERKEALEVQRTLLEEAGARRRNRRRERRTPAVPEDPTPLERGLRVYLPEPASLELDPAAADDVSLLTPSGVEDPDREGPARTVFSFLDASSTVFGARRLRHVLLHPLVHAEDLRRRQEAVLEAARRHDERARLLAALFPLRRRRLEPLTRFFAEAPTFAGRRALFILANVLGTAAPLFLVAIAVTGNLDFVVPLFALVLANLFLIAKNVKTANAARDRITLFGPLLDGLLRLEESLAASRPSAEEWHRIVETFAAIRPHAKRLRRHIALLELHSYGAIFELWNILTLWELRILPLADAVFGRHREHLERAVGALGEAEALLSLALPLAELDGFEIPEVLEEPQPVLVAREVGHPLVDPSAAVRNPVSLGREVNVLLVTGSNMAGKSTYLKSVGVNLILAGAGGPVCASAFQFTPMAFHSDINIRDSLDDGKSYFQVEVERVRKVIDAAQKTPFLLAVFDELFRGTNSEERLALARSIVRHIRSTGALLIVATHDLALTRLVTTDREPRIENRHFQETVDNGVMRFDYRLRPGPATTRNAIRVLEAQGYPEELIREARASL